MNIKSRTLLSIAAILLFGLSPTLFDRFFWLVLIVFPVVSGVASRYYSFNKALNFLLAPMPAYTASLLWYPAAFDSTDKADAIAIISLYLMMMLALSAVSHALVFLAESLNNVRRS